MIAATRKIFWFPAALGCLWLVCIQLWAASQPARSAIVLDIRGPIGPATSDYVLNGLRKAQTQGAALVILEMDTPGGLDSSMREIIQAILSSPVPVAAYVAPSGARAASAGTYILYASHIAAMAPGTNLGAATPVQLMGGEEPKQQDNTLHRKIVNDAVAYIRGLAQLRGRNADWAEQAVRKAASLPAQEAAKLRVIDFVADDVPQLLDKAQGRRVQVDGKNVVLQTRGLAVEKLEPDWRTGLLSVITDPNVAYVLMLVGIYGLIFELASPGFILPGVVGAICLVMALYAFHVLPVNYAGLGLILLGVAFMAAEAFVPSFGALGLGGLTSFVIGSIILMNTEAPWYTLSRPLIAGVALSAAIFFIGLLSMAVRARHRPVVSGRESMVGAVGEVLNDFQGRGWIHAEGENWQAISTVPLKRGQKVRVTSLEGLVVHVEPVAGKRRE